MDDLIKRQAVLDKAYELDLIDIGNDIQIWVVDVDEVKKLPAAEPRKWIPIAKRNPEESGRYLVTIYDGVITMATVARWLPRAKAWEMTGRRAHYHVTAWMPLPKPYEEESE